MDSLTKIKHTLALRLGVLVTDIDERMTVREFFNWVEYFTATDSRYMTEEELFSDG